MPKKTTDVTPPFDREDQEALERFIPCFDRGAFYTPFRMESSMPDFHKTMKQTIGVIGNGIRRDLDGTVIERIKSRHEFTNKNIATALARIQRMVEDIRGRFEQFVKQSEITDMPLKDSPIHVYSATPRARQTMDALRRDVLDAFRALVPSFTVTLDIDERDSGETEDFLNPSPPMSKRKAAARCMISTRELSRLMTNGTIRFREKNRQTFVFCETDLDRISPP